MKLSTEKLELVSTIEPDAELRDLVGEEGIIEKMSEKRMYNSPMPDSHVFRIFFDNELIGEVSLRNIKWFNRKAECSLFLKKEWHGKGFGEMALRMLINFAFNTMNLVRLEGEVIEYNRAAQGLMQKLGFVQEGVLRQAKYFNGRYYDILRFGLLRSEWDSE